MRLTFKLHAKILLLCAGVLYYEGAHAQAIDSLLTAYRQASDIRDKTNLQLQLAWRYQSQEAYSQAIAYYREVLESSDSARVDGLSVLKNISFCYNEMGDHNNEIAVEEKILRIQQRLKAPNIAIEKTLQNLSTLHIQKRDYARAVECNEKILGRAESDNNLLSLIQANNNLGFIYHLLNDPSRSAAYFDKSYQLVNEKDIALKDDDRANILINLGVVNVNIGNLKEAKVFFEKAHQIRKAQNDPIKIAQSLNYLATYDYLQNELDLARKQAEEAIALLIPTPAEDKRESTLADSYKIMAQIMMKRNDLKSFRKYNDLFTRQQDQIIQKERRRNKQLADRQLEAERTKNEIRILLAEQDKTRFKILQDNMEQQRKEQELQLKTTELQMLKKDNELQAEKYKNQDLETAHISQMLELEKQRSNALEQQQKIVLLQKHQEVQQLQLDKQKKEVEQLEKDKKQNREIRNYNLTVSALLFLLLLIALNLYFYRNRKNRMLTQQNATIRSVNDQLNERTEELHRQNDKILEAQEIIHEQHEKLISHSKNLEEEVERRTQEIRNANAALVKSNSQMEQFTYAISHNLRAPIARLLGLINIIQYANGQEYLYILDKIKESSFDLDSVIKDLSMILDAKYKAKEIIEFIDLNVKLEKTKLVLDKIIDETGAEIVSDYSHGHVLYANNGYIESIFYNLLSNSLKYRSPDRRCIIKVSSAIHDNLFVLSFTDNGIGIDLAKHGDKVFGLYKRFNSEIDGKGLGLYLVKSHAMAMGGEVQIESVPGMGTTFRIVLPIKKKNSEEEQTHLEVRQS